MYLPTFYKYTNQTKNIFVFTDYSDHKLIELIFTILQKINLMYVHTQY